MLLQVVYLHECLELLGHGLISCCMCRLWRVTSSTGYLWSHKVKCIVELWQRRNKEEKKWKTIIEHQYIWRSDMKRVRFPTTSQWCVLDYGWEVVAYLPLGGLKRGGKWGWGSYTKDDIFVSPFLLVLLDTNCKSWCSVTNTKCSPNKICHLLYFIIIIIIIILGGL